MTHAARILQAGLILILLAVPVASPVHAVAMLGAIWLWHDGLHECHEIAQKNPKDLHRSALNLHSKRSKTGQNVGSVESVEIDKAQIGRDLAAAMVPLNFWHAIMHRRDHLKP